MSSSHDTNALDTVLGTIPFACGGGGTSPKKLSQMPFASGPIESSSNSTNNQTPLFDNTRFESTSSILTNSATATTTTSTTYPHNQQQHPYQVGPMDCYNMMDQSSNSILNTSMNSVSVRSNNTVRPRGIVGRRAQSDGFLLTDASEQSRTYLRDTLMKRRRSLTRQETDFLEDLAVRGNESDVQAAYENLLDEELFFEPEDDWVALGNVQIGYEESTGIKETIITNIPKDTATSSNSKITMASSLPSNIGSERRQELLMERRKETWSPKLWKAHESGLAVSANASKRSVLVRASSVSGIIKNNHRDSIFRSKHIPSPPKQQQQQQMDDIRSDNNRRQRPPLQRPSQHPPRIPRGHPFAIATAKPVLRRGHHKSVSFAQQRPKRIHNRAASEGNFEHSFRVGLPPKTATSPPAVVQEDVALYDGMTSPPSIHLATGLRSESSILEEKKSAQWEDDNEIPKIPLKVEIPSSTTTSTSSSKQDRMMIQDATQMLTPSAQMDPSEASLLFVDGEQPLRRPVVMRRASTSNGEGIEITDWETEQSSPQNIFKNRTYSDVMMDYDVILTGNSLYNTMAGTTARSFDDSSLARGSGTGLSGIFRRVIRRTYSDESSTPSRFRLFPSRALMDDSCSSTIRDTSIGGYEFEGSYRTVRDISEFDESYNWKMEDDEEDEIYDAWKVIEDEYVNGYGGGGTLPFKILGTSADDVDAHPHVLSPPLMESLLAFLPTQHTNDNLWMKYSLVRDGASMHAFLQRARGAVNTFLAIETVDGEVFGAFVGAPWRKNWSYFGLPESFLWRMKQSRRTKKCNSIIDQAQLESEIEVFPYTGVNHNIQLCTHDKLAVGGGAGTSSPNSGDENTTATPKSEASQFVFEDGTLPVKEHEWGFGLTIESDFLHGTSSPCLTFGSPSLSSEHSDGSVFEIMNLELWTLTPCTRLEDAEKLEFSKLFLERNARE